MQMKRISLVYFRDIPSSNTICRTCSSFHCPEFSLLTAEKRFRYIHLVSSVLSIPERGQSYMLLYHLLLQNPFNCLSLFFSSHLFVQSTQFPSFNKPQGAKTAVQNLVVLHQQKRNRWPTASFGSYKLTKALTHFWIASPTTPLKM